MLNLASSLRHAHFGMLTSACSVRAVTAVFYVLHFFSKKKETTKNKFKNSVRTSINSVHRFVPQPHFGTSTSSLRQAHFDRLSDR